MITGVCEDCGTVAEVKRGRDGAYVCPACMAGPLHDGAEPVEVEDEITPCDCAACMGLD